VDEGNFDDEEFGVDLEEGLEELFDAIYIIALLGFLSDQADIFIDGDSLDADEDSSVEEVYDGIFLAALAYELDLEDDVDVAELPADSDLALEIEDDLIGDFDSRVEELETSFDEFDEGFTAIG
jgi:hypothetical protein